MHTNSPKVVRSNYFYSPVLSEKSSRSSTEGYILPCRCFKDKPTEDGWQLFLASAAGHKWKRAYFRITLILFWTDSRVTQNKEITDVKKSQICPIWYQSDPIGEQLDIPVVEEEIQVWFCHCLCYFCTKYISYHITDKFNFVIVYIYFTFVLNISHIT